MKYKIFLMIILVLILHFCAGCSSSKKLPECKELTNHKTEYFVAGIMDRHELKKEWLKEEIEFDKAADWYVKFCAHDLTELNEKDSALYNKQMKKLTEGFNETWGNICQKIKDGDRVFYYSTPDMYWGSLAGQSGLVVIRGCEIVYVMVLSQS